MSKKQAGVVDSTVPQISVVPTMASLPLSGFFYTGMNGRSMYSPLSPFNQYNNCNITITQSPLPNGTVTHSHSTCDSGGVTESHEWHQRIEQKIDSIVDETRRISKRLRRRTDTAEKNEKGKQKEIDVMRVASIWHVYKEKPEAVGCKSGLRVTKKNVYKARKNELAELGVCNYEKFVKTIDIARKRKTK